MEVFTMLWQFVPPRHRHAAAVVCSKIYVFGGICNDKTFSSLYILDTLTSEWTERETRGNWPGPLHSHSMESNCSKLYMFGGYNGEKALGYLYSFDVETSLWNKMKTYGIAPNARFSHSMFIYSNYLGVLGDCPVSGHQELSLLNFLSCSWKTIRMKSIEESILLCIWDKVQPVFEGSIMMDWILGYADGCLIIAHKLHKELLIEFA